MRWLVLGSFGLAACSLYSTDAGGSGSSVCGDCVQPFNSCGFYEGNDPVACSTPGATCGIETWEHGCSCGCGSDGWWSCYEETVGSQCPHSPIDAGIVLPDAIVVDAAPCSRIEAESIGEHPGWNLLSSSPTYLSGGYGLATWTAMPLVFDFTGTTFGVRHELGPNNTPMTVSIDGAPTAVDSYATTFAMTTTPIASGLASSLHHVTIVCGGSNCNVDYFDVTCN